MEESLGSSLGGKRDTGGQVWDGETNSGARFFLGLKLVVKRHVIIEIADCMH